MRGDCPAVDNAPRALTHDNPSLGHAHFTAGVIARMRGGYAIDHGEAALAAYDHLPTSEAGRRERAEALIADAHAKAALARH